MKTISIYIRSGNVCPSSYYRILQYSKKFDGDIKNRIVIPEFLYKQHNNNHGKASKVFWYSLYYLAAYFRLLFFLISDIIHKPDCIIVLRAMSPKICLFPINKLIKAALKKTTVIWDFDDDIFEAKEITDNEKEALIDYSKTIIVTNSFLKNLLPPKVQSKVILMPTTDGDSYNLDLSIVNEERRKTYEQEIRLLWVATNYSMKHLLYISDALEKAAVIINKRFEKKLVLNVVCNIPLEMNADFLKINNIIWTREIAQSLVTSSHIGIMPLKSTKFSLGKGGFKIVQYMAGGLPAIASNVGFNKEIILNHVTGALVDDEDNIENWVEEIIKMADNWNELEKFSYNALSLWNDRFSYESNLSQWSKIISQLE